MKRIEEKNFFILVYQYDWNGIEFQLELNNIHWFVVDFDYESIVNIDTNHSNYSLYMHQSIEWLNKQVKDFESVNPICQGGGRREHQSREERTYFCYTVDNGCFGIKRTNEYRIEKKKDQCKKNQDHIMEHSSTINSFPTNTYLWSIDEHEFGLTLIVELQKSSAIVLDVDQHRHLDKVRKENNHNH